MQNAEVSVILLTPAPDTTQRCEAPPDEGEELRRHAEQIRLVASDYEIGLCDSLTTLTSTTNRGHLSSLLAWSNHPSRAGHEFVGRELLRWFSFS